MKKKTIAIFFAILLITSISGFAAARASEYFSCTAVYATALDDGEVLIEYDIDPTHTMLECGARVIWKVTANLRMFLHTTWMIIQK